MQYALKLSYSFQKLKKANYNPSLKAKIYIFGMCKHQYLSNKFLKFDYDCIIDIDVTYEILHCSNSWLALI